MTSEERQLVALRRGVPDRVPVLSWLNPYHRIWATGIRADVDPREAGYAEVLGAARDCADAELDWGFPTGLFHTAWDLEPLREPIGTELERQTVRTPLGPLTTVCQRRSGGATAKHWVETVEDAKRLLSIPYVPVRPDLAELVAGRAASRGRYLTKVTLGDPAGSVGLIDPLVASLWSVEERPLLREILAAALERIRDEIGWVLASGAAELFYFNGAEYVLPPLMSPDAFEELVVVPDTSLVAQIHAGGGLTQIHCHGRVGRFLEAFARTGTDSLNVLEPPPLGDVVLADAKRRVGSRMCLVGNIQYQDLASASEDGVDALVRDCITGGAPGGGFVLALCAAPYEVPLPSRTARNLMRYMRAGRRYGA
jgi:hypothetical protein